MRIRKASEKDKPEIIKLVKEVLKEIFGKAENLQDLENIRKNFELFLVAEEKGKIIGTLGIKNEGDARISRMYVKKNKRGKGVGKKLMKKAIDFCKNKFNRIFLTTYKKMNSKDFYKKQGFKEYKQDERIWMEKKI